MQVSDLGEFGLIAHLRERLGVATDERIIAGIGDDAAVWRGGACTIATTDTMVAGVHFLPDRVSWRDVGWKALASNVSDVAAMGGTPSFALVTLCLPPSTPVEAVDALYDGLAECAGAYGVTIVGGDVVSAPVFAVTVALTGEPAAAADGTPVLLRRDAARPGDLIAVTGPLGGAAGGLRALTEAAARTPAHETLIARHMRPHPRVDAGTAAARAGVRCGIDISDGLAQDLGHICAASGFDAELRLPDVPLEAALVDAYGTDALTMAVTGGEDYELILVGREVALAGVSAALTPPPVIVGRVLETTGGRVRALDASMREVALPASGWDHLAPRA